MKRRRTDTGSSTGEYKNCESSRSDCGSGVSNLHDATCIPPNDSCHPTQNTKPELIGDDSDLLRPRICDAEDIPASHRFLTASGNPYIRRGYRVHYGTHHPSHTTERSFFNIPPNIRRILGSFWELHNETVNVHTHFWGSLVCALAVVYLMWFHPDIISFADTMDYIIIGSSMICVVTCFFASFIFHLFGCHSATVHRCVLASFCPPTH